MTGLALLALGSARTPITGLEKSISRAEQFARKPESCEGLCWLQLGLLRHGRDYSQLPLLWPVRTTRDIALRLLALAAHAPTNKLGWAS
jgi:hypothetical protein